MADKIAVFVGTDKGGFILTSDFCRARWDVSGPHLKGYSIYHMTPDTRDGSIYMAANHAVYGSEVVRSTDMGESWTHSDAEPRFPEGAGRKMEALWHIEPGRPAEPGVLYLGADPASLWKSEDSGKTWHEMKALQQHRSKPDWVPGAGGMCLHTIGLHPHDLGKISLGVSAVGFFQTEDGGETWDLRTEGIPAALEPRVDPASRRCVHKFVMDPDDPDTFYQQNHMGVFRSRNAGVSWEDIGGGLPETFGFRIAGHPGKSGTIWVTPSQGPDFRAPVDGAFKVFKSEDAGDSWRAVTTGLPQENAYLTPMREAMAVDGADPLGVYVGVKTGTLFGSSDEGESWRTIAPTLPPILSVEAAIL
jgi:hypothetical protein